MQRIRVQKLAEAYAKNGIPFPADAWDCFYPMTGDSITKLTAFWNAKARGEEPEEPDLSPNNPLFGKRNTNLDRHTVHALQYDGDPFTH